MFKILNKYILTELLRPFASSLFILIFVLLSNFILKNSPGQILRISECLSDVNADEKKDLPFIVDIFLDKFKKSKDQIYIDTIFFEHSVHACYYALLKNKE